MVNLGKFIFEKRISIQPNLFKTTTLATTQKWSFCTGGCLIKQSKTKSGCSWQDFSFSLHCECFINNKSLLEKRFVVSRVLVPYWWNTPIIKNVVLQAVLINESKSCGVSNQMFFDVIFSFSKKKRIGYNINIPK